MNEGIADRFGDRIRRLRLRRGWDQAELADVSGLGRSYISRIENGKVEACLHTIAALAGSFNMTVAQLMRGV